MAAAASKKYDVFISFRGEDTRTNFTSHLHAALCRNKIQTYIDYRLEKGDEVWPSLEKAIEDSSLFLVVFSENYASSTWCLNELVKILDCSKDEGQLVFPVFYKLDPTHVRKQTGTYHVAFTTHEHNNNKPHVQKWKAALTQIANLSGWHCSAHQNEAELVEEVVQCIIKKLNIMFQSVYADGLIGIHDQIAHLESLMCKESQDVRYIGIWGMGGIGKTTIATALFNKLCFAFESFCFLANVREESEKHGITFLKSKLISMLLESKESCIGMPVGAFTFAQRRLGQKKVLVVLDDVNDLEQLKNLVEVPNWFGKGSRVIITTRDKRLLSRNIEDIYEVQPMRFDEALQLFNLNAFKNSCLDMNFEQLSRKVVSYAKGIPLAIIVLGGFLCGKSKREWESQLEKMKKMPCAEIHQILKLSYEGLDYEEKNIFLDVACFFKGRAVEKIIFLLDACGYSTTIGLKSLQDKALLSVFDGKVYMHDLIQQMGWEIVREESFEEPGKRSRLWDPNDVYQVLKDNKGSEAIKGISLDVSRIEDLCLSPQVFAKMPKLKFLEIYDPNSKRQNLHLPRGLESLSNELRYLRWDKWPLKSLPLTFSAESLVELQMQDSGMRKLWHGVQNVVNLKIIDLCYSKHLRELPDFSKAFNLENVHLKRCSSLRKVHQSILSSQKLQLLALDDCVSLTSLTSDIHLKSLRHLSLCGCSRLKQFSIKSENLIFLNLFKTAISELPSFIGSLFKLELLDLRRCKGLKNLPADLFDGLRSLKELWLDDCCNLIELPHNISNLSSLRLLSIVGMAVESLPTNLKDLSNLNYFELRNCKRLRCLPELPTSVELLDAIDCTSLETVTSSTTEPLGGMKYTRFQNCKNLDQHSIKAILANVVTHISKSVSQLENYSGKYNQTEVVYPGSRVPEWFKYRTTHASITIDLSSAPLSMDWGLIFCIVSSPSQSIRCKGYFRIIDDQSTDEDDDADDDNYDKDDNVFYHIDATNLNTEHVSLWYNAGFCFTLHQRIKESKSQGSYCNPKVLCKMNVLLWDKDERKLQRPRHYCKEIKGCGVCPTYASEYQSFIKEMEGILPPKQKPKGLIFPSLPTATSWKNGTQGFKDVIFLSQT